MEFVWSVLELVRQLYDEWFERSVDRGRRNQARGHLARGRDLLKKGLYRQAETEFRCALYFHPDKRDLLMAVDELRQASLENSENDAIHCCYQEVLREFPSPEADQNLASREGSFQGLSILEPDHLDKAAPSAHDGSNHVQGGDTYRAGLTVKPGSGIRPPGTPYGPARPLGPRQWIEASQSPFGIRVLDCRSLTHDTVSTTTNMQIALRFTDLRSSNGEQHRGSVPSESLHTDCNLTYPPFDKAGDGSLFVAQEMEDKWDIYLFDRYIYFARSWTSDLIFRARIDLTGGGSRISSIDAKSGAVNKDTSLAIREVDFLVKSHLFKREVPHPIPADFPEESDKIAIYSFQLYGRWASYATYEDTTKIRIGGGN